MPAALHVLFTGGVIAGWIITVWALSLELKTEYVTGSAHPSKVVAPAIFVGIGLVLGSAYVSAAISGEFSRFMSVAFMTGCGLIGILLAGPRIARLLGRKYYAYRQYKS